MGKLIQAIDVRTGVDSPIIGVAPNGEKQIALHHRAPVLTKPIGIFSQNPIREYPRHEEALQAYFAHF